MIGTGSPYPRMMRSGVVLGAWCFSPNAASDPDSQYTKGDLVRFITGLVHNGTGDFLLTFSTNFAWPTTHQGMFAPSAMCADASSWFDVFVGPYNATTRQIHVYTHRAGVPYDPPASTGSARVQISFTTIDSTGK